MATDSSTAVQAPATASLSLSAGSGAFALTGQDATLAGGSQLEQLRELGTAQKERRARRAAITAELAELHEAGRQGEFDAAPLLKALADQARAEDLEQLRHDTAWPL